MNEKTSTEPTEKAQAILFDIPELFDSAINDLVRGRGGNPLADPLCDFSHAAPDARIVIDHELPK